CKKPPTRTSSWTRKAECPLRRSLRSELVMSAARATLAASTPASRIARVTLLAILISGVFLSISIGYMPIAGGASRQRNFFFRNRQAAYLDWGHVPNATPRKHRRCRRAHWL